jgi:hypothetical protein
MNTDRSMGRRHPTPLSYFPIPVTRCAGCGARPPVLWCDQNELTGGWCEPCWLAGEAHRG